MKNTLFKLLIVLALFAAFIIGCANDIQGEGNTINNESNINPTFRNEQHNSTNKLGITASLARDNTKSYKSANDYYYKNYDWSNK